MGSKNKICLQVHLGGKKKIKWKFHEFNEFLGIFNMFFTRKIHVWRGISELVGGENKKKAEMSVFFLVGPDSSSSEDSSTVEYKAHALSSNIKILRHPFLVIGLKIIRK